MRRSSENREQLQHHQRQPQREEHGRADHAHEAHRVERLALNVSDAEEEAAPKPDQALSDVPLLNTVGELLDGFLFRALRKDAFSERHGSHSGLVRLDGLGSVHLVGA